MNERIGKGQHIDHRQLPVHRKLRAEITAEPEKGKRQIANTKSLISARITGNPLLQHKDADQHKNRKRQHRNLNRLILPRLARNLLLHAQFARIIGGGRRALIGGNRSRLRRRGRRLHIIRVGNLLHIRRGQTVIHVIRNERLFPRGGGALHQQLQLPRTGYIQRLLLRHNKQRNLRKTRRALGKNIAEAAVVAVAEVETAAILLQLQPVKNPATHIARTLERIQSLTSDENRLLLRLQLLLQLRVARIAEQTAANRRHRHRRIKHLNELIFRIGALRMLCPFRVLRFGERLINLAHLEMERTHRAITGQLLPGAHRLIIHINDRQLLRLRGRGTLSLAAALHRLRRGNRRAGNRLVNHHHRNRRAANHIRRLLIHAIARIIAPGVGVDIRIDLLHRNTDENNRLGVLDQLRLLNREILVHRDHDMNRLAGITAGRHIIRVEENIAKNLLALEHRHDRRIVLNRAIAGGIGEKLGRGHLAGELLQRAVAMEQRGANLLRRRHRRGECRTHKK